MHVEVTALFVGRVDRRRQPKLPLGRAVARAPATAPHGPVDRVVAADFCACVALAVGARGMGVAQLHDNVSAAAGHALPRTMPFHSVHAPTAKTPPCRWLPEPIADFSCAWRVPCLHRCRSHDGRTRGER